MLTKKTGWFYPFSRVLEEEKKLMYEQEGKDKVSYVQTENSNMNSMGFMLGVVVIRVKRPCNVSAH